MKQVVCAIFDSASGIYSRPAFVQSKAVAIRSFGDEVNRVAEDNNLNKHPGDFALYVLGTFDDEAGTFEGEPERLSTASELLLP